MGLLDRVSSVRSINQIVDCPLATFLSLSAVCTVSGPPMFPRRRVERKVFLPHDA